MSTEASFSYTTKIGGDLFTVRGNNPAEFKANLEAAVTANLIDYALAVQEAANKPTQPAGVTVAEQHLGAHVIPAAAAPDNPWATPAPAPAPAAPAGDGPTCAHGPMTFKSGTAGPNSKTPGKPYKMWACTGPRGSTCDPVWVR